MTLLSMKKFGVSLAGRQTIKKVTLEVTAGEVVCLIGPNGAGKTTLMRGALGLVKSTGYCSLLEMPSEDRARLVAWMPQDREVAWPISVQELVLIGRLPHGAGSASVSNEDQGHVDRALHVLDLESLRNRPANELSGGEKARALLARAIAQDTKLILADEPTAGLDPGHQITAMTAFKSLANAGKGVVVSLHDLGLAARYATRLVLLNDGEIFADGQPLDVLTPETLKQVFGISAHLEQTDDGLIFQTLTVI